MMEVVACYCVGCKAELCRFRNSWNGVGNTYVSPVHTPISSRGLKVTGEVYEAARESQIADSLLQDVACEKCQTVLGLRCDRAPEGHFLTRDQFILRLKAMTVISEGSGEVARISILQNFSLKSASSEKMLSLRRASTALPSPRPYNSPYHSKVPSAPSMHGRASVQPYTAHKPLISSKLSVRREFVQLSRNHDLSRESQKAPTQDKAWPTPGAQPLLEVQKFKSWAEGAISSQQKDIDRISGALERIEGDMRLLKDFMQEIRSERISSQQIQSNQCKKELAEMRKNIDTLRKSVVEVEQYTKSKVFETASICQIRGSRHDEHLDLLQGEVRSCLANEDIFHENLNKLVSKVTSQGQRHGQAFISTQQELSKLTRLLNENVKNTDVMQDRFERIAEALTASVRRTEVTANEVKVLKGLMVTFSSRLHRLEDRSAVAVPDIQAPVVRQPNKRKFDYMDDTQATPEAEQSPLQLPIEKRRLQSSVSMTAPKEDKEVNFEEAENDQGHARPEMIYIAASSPMPSANDAVDEIQQDNRNPNAHNQHKSSPQVVIYVSTPRTPRNSIVQNQAAIPQPQLRTTARSNTPIERRRSGNFNLRDRQPVSYQGLDLAPSQIETAVGRLSREDDGSDRRTAKRTRISSVANTKSNDQSTELQQLADLPDVEKDDNKKRYWKCEGCYADFVTPIGRDNHIRDSKKCQPKPKFPCESCDKRFAAQVGLNYHYSHSSCKAKSEVFPTPAAASGTKSYTCDTCNRSWKSNTQLDYHICPQKTPEEESAELKQAKLAARERLVRETLKREMR